ncbi:hypothetical protein F0919_15330 [Taibaiella lutea]|uniref:Uncharacterized protein n=1 Tax=Taibaiella lutea TaxID=2608001 RepID=A0A5M6CB01_9BACT|nr:SIR2 family protein [Taibaiella lutea]KAA5532171.1 hypothetical protein F0919_15330 [Taibaiella lutea]
MADRNYASLESYYRKEERYLFLRNGINQLHQDSISWKELLNNIKSKVNINIDLDERKSNTLLFEEMAFAMNGSGRIEDNIRQLKVLLGEEAMKLKPHDRCMELVNSGIYQHFITTNYDYCIERSIDDVYEGQTGKYLKRPKYSLYRYNLIGNNKVWHIHGECNNGIKERSKVIPRLP